MKFKKKFGQNFLRSSRFSQKIVELLNLKTDDVVIEIGPGDGFVTNELLKHNVKVISIEIDYDLLANLLKKFSNYHNFHLENLDFLDVDLDELLCRYDIRQKIKICGSLPFNVSKKIIQKILEWNYLNNLTRVEKCIFIVQEEVAKTYCAKPPKATMLSTISSFYGNFKKHESISSSCFIPRPKVNSAIMSVDFENIEVLEANKLNKILNLIKIAYRRPNKMLKNVLNKFFLNKKNLVIMTKRPIALNKGDWEDLLLNLV